MKRAFLAFAIILFLFHALNCLAQEAKVKPTLLTEISCNSLQDKDLIRIVFDNIINYEYLSKNKIGVIITPQEKVFSNLPKASTFRQGIITCAIEGSAPGIEDLEKYSMLDTSYYVVKSISISIPAYENLFRDFTSQDQDSSVDINIATQNFTGIEFEEIPEEIPIAVQVEKPEDILMSTVDKVVEEKVIEAKSQIQGELEQKVSAVKSELGNQLDAKSQENMDKIQQLNEKYLEWLKAEIENAKVSLRETVKQIEIEKRIKEYAKKEAKIKTEEKVQQAYAIEATQLSETIGKEILEEAPFQIGEKPLSLQEAIDTAAINSKEIGITQEERKLARIKYFQALRSFFPAAYAEAYQTKGELLEDVKFIEKKYGIQVEQPLFGSGVYIYSYLQAKTQLEMAQKKMNKVKTDIDFNITEAYYNLVSAQANLKYQENALSESMADLKATEDVYARGMITNEEVLNVRSLHDQALFHLTSAKKDLVLTRLKLFQSMGIKDPGIQAQYGETSAWLEFVPKEIDLNQVVELAQTNRLDLHIARLSVKSHKYEETIAKRKEWWPQASLTGFIGQSASYYTTEDENFKNDWNIGVKVSMGLGPNTNSYMYTKEQTSPQLGQTTRTGTETHSAKIGIVDNLEAYSKEKDAKIGKLKADKDLDELEKQVMLEAKEAYYDYQGAVIRMRNGLEKVRFYEQKYTDTKLRVGSNELPVSQLMEVRMKLADEKGLYIKALADSFVALAKLDKVIGTPWYFTKVVTQESQEKKDEI